MCTSKLRKEDPILEVWRLWRHGIVECSFVFAMTIEGSMDFSIIITLGK